MFRPSLLVICALLAAALTVTGGCGDGSSGRVASSSRSSLPEYLRYPGAQAVGDMDRDVDGVGTSLNVLQDNGFGARRHRPL